MTVGVGGDGWERLWLDRRLTKNGRGHFELTGDCHRDRIIVEIDPSITRGISDDEAEARLDAMHKGIQNAARSKYRECEAYEEYPEPGSRVLRIALTTEDLK